MRIAIAVAGNSSESGDSSCSADDLSSDSEDDPAISPDCSISSVWLMHGSVGRQEGSADPQVLIWVIQMGSGRVHAEAVRH